MPHQGRDRTLPQEITPASAGDAAGATKPQTGVYRMPAVVKFKNPPRQSGRIHPDDPELDLDGFLAVVRQAVDA